jgi:hypothetical protein
LEAKRTPDALKQNGGTYSRIDMSGKVSLTSHRSSLTEIEVTRYVLGTADTAEPNARIEKVNVFEDGDFLGTTDYPYWWGWYGWPYWWHHVNGVGRITWKVKLESNQSLDLNYAWHYFWQ